MSNKNTTWATLVYLAGDNNLSEEMVWSLQEMKKTIEADKNGVFGNQVKVIAQYDARGANPRTYKLTEPRALEGDGNLSEVGGVKYSAKEILDCVQKRIEPSAEQWARATFHLLELSNKELYKTLTTGTLAKDCCDLPKDEAIAFLSEDEAIGFLAEMLLLSEEKRRDYTRDDIDDLTIEGAQALPRILKRVIADLNGTPQKVQKKRAEQVIDEHKKPLAQQLKRADLKVALESDNVKLLCKNEFSSLSPPYLGLLGEDLPIPKWQAVCFVLHLLLYSESERDELIDEDGTGLNKKGGDRLSALLRLIIQKGSEATPDEPVRAERIIEKVSAFIVEQFKQTPAFPDTSDNENTLNLSELISRSSDSLSKHMSGLTSAHIAEEFIEKQAKLAGEVDHHLVVLSGHGSGAVGDFLTDDDPESSLSIPILGKLLKSAQLEINDGDEAGETKISILGMDSCLMSMTEVCYEVQDCIEYIVGAEGFVPNTGWPYHRVLEAVVKVAKNNKDPKDLAQEIVRKYIDFYKDYDVAMVSVDLAAIQVGKIGRTCKQCSLEEPLEFVKRELPGPKEANLAELILSLAKCLTAALMSPDQPSETRPELTDELRETGKSKNEKLCRKTAAAVRDAVTLAHLYAQSYKGDQYVDLYDFCEQLKRFCENPKIKGCAQAIMDKLDEPGSPVLLSCYWGADSQHSHGLSVYFPWSISDYVPEYSNLKFARDTGWDEFIWTYLRSTLRVRRHQEEEDNWVKDSKGNDVPKPPKRFGPEELSKEFLLLDDKQAQYGTAKSSQYGTAKSSQWGTAKSSQFGTAKSAQYGTARSSQYGTAKSSQYGTAKFLGKCFQSSMKNGPDGFYECKDLKAPKAPKQVED